MLNCVIINMRARGKLELYNLRISL